MNQFVFIAQEYAEYHGLSSGSWGVEPHLTMSQNTLTRLPKKMYRLALLYYISPSLTDELVWVIRSQSHNLLYIVVKCCGSKGLEP